MITTCFENPINLSEVKEENSYLTDDPLCLKLMSTVEQLAEDHVRIVKLAHHGFYGYGWETKLKDKPTYKNSWLKNPQACGCNAIAVMVAAQHVFSNNGKTTQTKSSTALPGNAMLCSSVDSIREQMDRNELNAYALFIGDGAFSSFSHNEHLTYFGGHAFTIIQFPSQKDKPAFLVYQSYAEKYSLKDFIKNSNPKIFTRQIIEKNILSNYEKILHCQERWTKELCEGYEQITGVDVKDHLLKKMSLKPLVFAWSHLRQESEMHCSKFTLKIMLIAGFILTIGYFYYNYAKIAKIASYVIGPFR